MTGVRVLLVDNHDSYTWNLAHLLALVPGTDVQVLANDDPRLPEVAEDVDALVVSPGPGRPQHRRDLGLVTGLLAATGLPVLGVCLGHQAIAHAAGGRVVPAPRPRHGHVSAVRHAGDPLFDGVPEEFAAVRYHSLCVAEPLPGTLVPLAWSEDGVLQALRHADLPRWGVQFHPESVATGHGQRIVGNFLASVSRRVRRDAGHPPEAVGRTAGPQGRITLQVLHEQLPTAVDTEAAHAALLAGTTPSFWLDSSRTGPGLARVSVLGTGAGPLAEVLTYRAGEGTVAVSRDGTTTPEEGTVLEALRRRLQRYRLATDPGLPVDLAGGWVGVLGYELAADWGAATGGPGPLPDAVWTGADRLVVVDHEAGRTHVVALFDEPGRADAACWVAETVRGLAGLPPAPSLPVPAAGAGDAGPVPQRWLARNRARYLADIAVVDRALRAGESYEVCLTNTLHVPHAVDDVALHLALRRRNPAPYGGLLRFGDWSLVSSSPERFLRVTGDGCAESKPIKGTVARADDPGHDAQRAAALAADPKNRAENLMIVDLLRNDLSRVCVPGSVEVPVLMGVESYATVHHLVSTVTGRLADGQDPVTCLRALFPGGSMTGAPKERTMELIAGLEDAPRGPYSGAFGYLGLARPGRGATADLAVTIRSAVLTPAGTTVGGGGAVVLDSDPEAEWEEMLHKVDAVWQAVAPLLPPTSP